MDKREEPGLEIRDPKLPAVRAGQAGNAMEARRRGASGAEPYCARL